MEDKEIEESMDCTRGEHIALKGKLNGETVKSVMEFEINGGISRTIVLVCKKCQCVYV